MVVSMVSALRAVVRKSAYLESSPLMLSYVCGNRVDAVQVRCRSLRGRQALVETFSNGTASQAIKCKNMGQI